jgi:hypothetical protein
LVSHVKRYYYPNLPEEKIREVHMRGDGHRLWRVAQDNPVEQEYPFGWGARHPGALGDQGLRCRHEPRVTAAGQVEATLSWIEGIGKLARARNVPLVVFVVPVGSVDPDYVEFWKPWPRDYSWNHICDELHSRLASALDKTALRFVDLRETLDGIPRTYRKLNGHWSRKGEEIVAARVTQEVGRLFG